LQANQTRTSLVKTLQLMVVSPVPDSIPIQSHRGTYEARFTPDLLDDPSVLLEGEPHFIIDSNIARLYSQQLQSVLSHPNVILVDATEQNKSLESASQIITTLVAQKTRRNHHLVAIGGGIIQDLVCFIASTLLRGVSWQLVPTTLLAQADSCIGSKSSINVGDAKNIVGTFYPPTKIYIDQNFLQTLHQNEIHSGIGEILKVHAIDSAESFNRVASSLSAMTKDLDALQPFIYSALTIKKRYIEVDEFDEGIRNIFNFGHSFGHAIESATNFGVPHGVAVTMGMDVACQIAASRNLLPISESTRMRTALKLNYQTFAHVPIPLDASMNALLKDKKNSSTELGLILPVGQQANIEKVMVPPNEEFVDQFRHALGAIAQ
jgi:3-dehydroquinate synthase